MDCKELCCMDCRPGCMVCKVFGIVCMDWIELAPMVCNGLAMDCRVDCMGLAMDCRVDCMGLAMDCRVDCMGLAMDCRVDCIGLAMDCMDWMGREERLIPATADILAREH